MTRDYSKKIQNQNLQQSNNFVMIIEQKDERLQAKDIIFRLKNFPIPGMTIPTVEIPTLIQKIPFPTQGHLQYDDLTLDMLVDDNLNNYFELCRWVYRLDNPEYLFSRNNDPNTFLEPPKTPYINDLYQTDQYPVDYRDISILIFDTNGQLNHRLCFVEAFPIGISTLQVDLQQANYMSLTSTFKFLLMNAYDAQNNKIL